MKGSQGIAGTPNWPKTTTTDCEFELESEATNGYVIHVMDIAEGGKTCESSDQRIKVEGTYIDLPNLLCIFLFQY